MDMVDAYYRQVDDRGSPLLPFQERKLDKIIQSWHVNKLAEKNYVDLPLNSNTSKSGLRV